MSSHEFEYDFERGKLVIGALLEEYHEKRGIFSVLEMPQREPPNGFQHGSLEHAMFLFIMTVLDTFVKSSEFYRSARQNLTDEDLDAEHWANLSKGDLEAKIFLWKDKEGINYGLADKRLPWIVSCCQRLVIDYGGDPRKIMQAGSLEEVYRRIEKFKGYGPETARLLVCDYYKSGIHDFPDDWVLEPKIDFHDIRTVIHLGLVKITPYEGSIRHDRMTKVVRDYIVELCRRNDFDVVDVDNALWLLGSNICVQRDILECQGSCPVYEWFEGPMPSTYNNISGNVYLVNMLLGRTLQSKNKEQGFFPPWKNILFHTHDIV